MRIGIDARVLEKKVTGIGRTLEGILRNIPDIDESIEFVLFTNSPIHFHSKNCVTVVTNSNHTSYKLLSPLWIYYILPSYLHKHGIDLYFSPNYYLPPSLHKKNIKSIVVVHDVIHKVKPEFHPFVYNTYLDVMVKHTIAKSDCIITDSVSSKRDIIHHYKIENNKVEVIYPFAHDKFYPRELSAEEKAVLQRKYRLPNEFILFVGVIEARKNITGILKINKRLQARGRNIPIVLIGREGYGGHELINQISSESNIQYLQYVEDDDLPLIYNLSKVFLFPSHYEGFGYPPLEAMKSGIPVVSSNAGSLPEIIGSNIPMADPDDTDSFVNEIEKLLFQDEYYNELKLRGMERAKIFEMRKSLDKFISVIHRISD